MQKVNEKVVFIDRDGVINEDPIGDYVKTCQDFRFMPGVIRALKRLTGSDFQIVIISNQAGVGDGEYTEEALNAITKNMISELKDNGIPVRGVYYCTHGKNAGCECRKPEVGLFKQAARDIKFNRFETYFIGDKISDVQAGHSFNLKTLFVLTGHGATDRTKIDNQNPPEGIFPSLKEAVDYVLSQGKK